MAKEKQVENDYRDFIELLNKNNVEYLVIGAYSVIFHTKIARETKDFDVWIKNTEDNAEKCAAAIKEFCGLKINKDDLLGKKEIFFIGEEPNRIDIFNSQEGILFDDAYSRKVVGEFRNVAAYFISKIDLVKLKEYFQRSSDIKDIKRLKK
ncbi:MAG: DUF6036 family nucleotidyltransferase [bacterium]